MRHHKVGQLLCFEGCFWSQGRLVTLLFVFRAGGSNEVKIRTGSRLENVEESRTPLTVRRSWTHKTKFHFREDVANWCLFPRTTRNEHDDQDVGEEPIAPDVPIRLLPRGRQEAFKS